MKWLFRCGSVLMAVALCGCFDVKDELALQPDGSGTVRITVRSSLPEEMTGMLGMSSRFGGGGSVMYPPTSEAEARRFFPARDFTLKTEQKAEKDGKALVIEAAFKDVNALLASPYARAHQLVLKLDSNVLKLQGLSGGEPAARAAQLRAGGEMEAFPMPGMEELQKKTNEMTFSFAVTLPNALAACNGTQQGKTATWSVARAQCKDQAEFVDKLSGVLEARCSAEGVKFSPVSPPRLALQPFNDLVAGKAASVVSLPDTNKVLAAARFVPLALQVTRSVDLSGEGSSHQSRAQLSGLIVLPPDLAPQRWGEPKLEEVLDARNNSLMPKEDENRFFPGGTSFNRFGLGLGEESEEELGAENQKKAPEQQQHPVTLSFVAPAWKVKEIEKIKGSIELQYVGGSEVLKLSNAVPASLVRDLSKRTSWNFSSDADRGQVNDPRLGELGLSLRVSMAMVQSGMTTLSLQTGRGKNALLDVQVFDAAGRPWPTTLMQTETSGSDEQSCQVMVTGQPQPPFSLAVLVGGVGASVNLPVLLEKVPVDQK